MPPVRARAGSARQNRSNTWGRSSGAIPSPVSTTAISTPSSSSLADTVTEPPGGVWHSAFSNRLRSTCVNRSGSAWRIGRSLDTSAVRTTPSAWAAGARLSMVDRMTWPTSVGRRCIRSCPASARASSRRSSTRRLNRRVSSYRREISTSFKGYTPSRMARRLPWSTVSGVRSSWAASATMFCRWRSDSPRAVVISLNAWATSIISSLPSTSTWWSRSPAATARAAAASRCRGAVRLRLRSVPMANPTPTARAAPMIRICSIRLRNLCSRAPNLSNSPGRESRR